MASREQWRGVLALIACAALWSFGGPLIKLLNAGGTGVPGVTIACFRSLIGGLVFLPFAWRGRAAFRTVSPAWPLGSVAAFTLMTACFVVANVYTTAANAIVLQYTSPLWVFLLSPVLLHERPHRSEGFALLLAMAGVAIIFFGNPASDVPGLAVALLSGLGYGTLTVLLRGLRAVPPPVVTCLNFLGSGLLLLPAVALWGSFRLTWPQIGLLLLLSLGQFALPYLLFSRALQIVLARHASLIVLLETLLNPLWTYLIIGETVSPATLMGAPFILASVAGWLLLHRSKAAG